jgi:hypothetical protein
VPNLRHFCFLSFSTLLAGRLQIGDLLCLCLLEFISHLCTFYCSIIHSFNSWFTSEVWLWFWKWKVYWLRGKTTQEGTVSYNNFQVVYISFFFPFVVTCLDLDTQTNVLQVSVCLCALFYDKCILQECEKFNDHLRRNVGCVTWQCKLVCSVQCTCIELNVTGSLPHINIWSHIIY